MRRVRRRGKERVKVVVVGSIGLDTVETPFEKRERQLGGSVSYACAAASFHAPVGMVGVVGRDFPEEYEELYRLFGIDLEGLQRKPGRTFAWSGVYEPDMIRRRTRVTKLNVFASFAPELPESYRDAPFLLLGNISPALQLHVLGQMRRPRFVVADTMDMWIAQAREDLDRVIARVNMLMLNDDEAALLTGERNLKRAAAAILKRGPRYVVVKKGEHGSMLCSRGGVFLLPAYPVDQVYDPTGAGDTFAGGFLGSLAARGVVTDGAVRAALLHGSVAASFAVESFSLDRLARLNVRDIQARHREYRGMLAVPGK